MKAVLLLSYVLKDNNMQVIAPIAEMEYIFLMIIK